MAKEEPHDPVVRTAPAVADLALPEPRTQREVLAFVKLTRNASVLDVPFLRRMALESRSPLVAGNALRALGRLRSIADEPQLIALLQDPRPRIRQEVVMALGSDGRAESVPLLEQTIAGGDAPLRALTIQALGKIGGSEAERTLEWLLADPGTPDTERVFAQQALRDAAAGRRPRHRQTER